MSSNVYEKDVGRIVRVKLLDQDKDDADYVGRLTDIDESAIRLEPYTWRFDDDWKPFEGGPKSRAVMRIETAEQVGFPDVKKKEPRVLESVVLERKAIKSMQPYGDFP